MHASKRIPPPSPDGQPRYSTLQSESLCVACVYWGRDETPRRESRRAHFLIIPNYKSAKWTQTYCCFLPSKREAHKAYYMHALRTKVTVAEVLIAVSVIEMR